MDTSIVLSQTKRIMFDKLASENKLLTQAIEILIKLHSDFTNSQHNFVLAHGDAHHFNILQNQKELFLLD